VSLASEAETLDAPETDEARSASSTVEDVGHALLMRFPSHLTADIAAAMTAEVARLIRRRDAPTRIVADLSWVETFDMTAPIAAVRKAVPVSPMIECVEIIAKRRVVRVAAVSAARLLGLRCITRHR
jgi:hypothetical protein